MRKIHRHGMVLAPIFVVPFIVIIAKGSIFFVSPVFTPLDMTRPLKLNTRDGRIGLDRQIVEVLQTKRIRFCLVGSGTDGAGCYAMLCLLDGARSNARLRRLRYNHPGWDFHSASLFPFAILLSATESLTLRVRFIQLFFCKRRGGRLR
jgi:hypothetical protein